MHSKDNICQVSGATGGGREALIWTIPRTTWNLLYIPLQQPSYRFANHENVSTGFDMLVKSSAFDEENL